MTFGMIFRQTDQIVKLTGGQYHQLIDGISCRQFLRWRPDTTKVSDVMGSIKLLVMAREPGFKLRLPV